MLLTVATHLHWPPNVLDGLHLDEGVDHFSLNYWYNEIVKNLKTTKK